MGNTVTFTLDENGFCDFDVFAKYILDEIEIQGLIFPFSTDIDQIKTFLNKCVDDHLFIKHDNKIKLNDEKNFLQVMDQMKKYFTNFFDVARGQPQPYILNPPCIGPPFTLHVDRSSSSTPCGLSASQSTPDKSKTIGTGWNLRQQGEEKWELTPATDLPFYEYQLLSEPEYQYLIDEEGDRICLVSLDKGEHVRCYEIEPIVDPINDRMEIFDPQYFKILRKRCVSCSKWNGCSINWLRSEYRKYLLRFFFVSEHNPTSRLSFCLWYEKTIQNSRICYYRYTFSALLKRLASLTTWDLSGFSMQSFITQELYIYRPDQVKNLQCIYDYKADFFSKKHNLSPSSPSANIYSPYFTQNPIVSVCDHLEKILEMGNDREKELLSYVPLIKKFLQEKDLGK